MHGEVSLLQKAFPQRLRLSERGEARLELHGSTEAAAYGRFVEGLEATPVVLSGQSQGPG